MQAVTLTDAFPQAILMIISLRETIPDSILPWLVRFFQCDFLLVVEKRDGILSSLSQHMLSWDSIFTTRDGNAAAFPRPFQSLLPISATSPNLCSLPSDISIQNNNYKYACWRGRQMILWSFMHNLHTVTESYGINGVNKLLTETNGINCLCFYIISLSIGNWKYYFLPSHLAIFPSISEPSMKTVTQKMINIWYSRSNACSSLILAS